MEVLKKVILETVVNDLIVTEVAQFLFITYTMFTLH